MTTSIDTFKKIMFDLDIGATNYYSLSNDISNNNNTCYLNFNLLTTVQNKLVTITFQQYSALNGTLENTETFTLNYKNNSLSKNINLISPYTLISISYNAFNGILTGFIEKLTIGNVISMDTSGQTIAVRGGVDISGQRIDISGQYIMNDDFELQKISSNINNNVQYSNIKLSSIDNNYATILSNIISNNTKLTQNTYIDGKLKADISGQKIDISGQRIDISGQQIVISSNNNTTNNYNKTGINIYQIFPKKIFCILSGSNGNNIVNQLLGGPVNNSLTIGGINFGQNYSTIWYGDVSGTSPVTYYIDYTYVDSNGDIVTENNKAINATLTSLAGGNPIRGLLQLNSRSSTLGSPNNHTINIYPTNVTTSCLAGMSYSDTYNSLIPIPNNYVGYLKNFCWFSALACTFHIVKYMGNSDGRQTMWTSTNVTNFTYSADPICGIFEAGTACIVYRETASTSCKFYGTFVLEAT